MPQMTDERVRVRLTREEDISLLHEVSMKTAGVSHLEMCIQCGTCGGSCPSAMAMEHTPRMLFAMLRAGMRDEAYSIGSRWHSVPTTHVSAVQLIPYPGRCLWRSRCGARMGICLRC